VLQQKSCHISTHELLEESMARVPTVVSAPAPRSQPCCVRQERLFHRRQAQLGQRNVVEVEISSRLIPAIFEVLLETNSPFLHASELPQSRPMSPMPGHGHRPSAAADPDPLAFGEPLLAYRPGRGIAGLIAGLSDSTPPRGDDRFSEVTDQGGSRAAPWGPPESAVNPPRPEVK
jgi:hypothetical protein